MYYIYHMNKHSLYMKTGTVQQETSLKKLNQ